jgi:Uncharacterised nucleotidyltransferase
VKDSVLRGSFWPTPTQEALLRITLGPSQEAAAVWRELQPIDLQALEAGSFCLMPLLYERLSEVAPSDDRLPLLRGTLRSNWLRSQLLIEHVTALLPAFRSREIEPLVLGGPAIVTRWYPVLGSRPLPQIELACGPTHWSAAADVVEANGWRQVNGDGVHRSFVDDEAQRMVLHKGVPPLVAGPLGRTGAFHDLRGRAVPLTVISARMLVLAPADELMIACGLGARTTLPPTIQWLLDAAKALASPDRPDPHELVDRARCYRLVLPLRETIRYLARFPAVDVDCYLAALLAEPVGRREASAYRLTGFGGGALSLPQVLASGLRTTAEVPPMRALLGLPQQVQEVWEVTSLRQMLAVGARKLFRIVRRRRSPHIPGQPFSGSRGGRNRSASS